MEVVWIVISNLFYFSSQLWLDCDLSEMSQRVYLIKDSSTSVFLHFNFFADLSTAENSNTDLQLFQLSITCRVCPEDSPIC